MNLWGYCVACLGLLRGSSPEHCIGQGITIMDARYHSRGARCACLYDEELIDLLHSCSPSVNCCGGGGGSARLE